jgi:hypothetical protein
MNQVGHIRAQPDRAHSMHQNTPFSSKKIVPINIGIVIVSTVIMVH